MHRAAQEQRKTAGTPSGLMRLDRLSAEHDRHSRAAPAAAALELVGATAQFFLIGRADGTLCAYDARGRAARHPLGANEGSDRRLVVSMRHGHLPWPCGPPVGAEISGTGKNALLN